jgi:N-acetylneuraminic acid mutarotase
MKNIFIAAMLLITIYSCKKQTEDTSVKNNIQEELSAPVPPTNYWTFKLNVPVAFGVRSGMANFVIGNKAYIFGGYDWDGSGQKKDLWEYDPIANTFTQKASLPASAPARIAPAAFSINGKGYIATGYGGPVLKDLWEYDPVANSWNQKADMPGLGRWKAVGFAINGKGYIATGNDFGSTLKDIWEYNPVSNSWTQKANMPTASGREEAFVFVFNNKAYVGGGYQPTNKTMYEFDPSQGTNGLWLQKANYPGQGSLGIAAFATNLAGYAGTGAILNGGFTFYKDFWRYSPSTNTWTSKQAFLGTTRAWAMGFSINGIGYMGLGRDENDNTNNRDLYRYVQ